MVPGLAVTPVESVPGDVGELLTASRIEGYDFVERFVDECETGSNRFDRPGEAFFEVRRVGLLVALGGLNRDPYLDDPSVGRIRRVYVHPDFRRRGVGQLLVSTLVDHARDHFRRVRLRVGPPAAGGFYIRLGFSLTPAEEHSTHELRF